MTTSLLGCEVLERLHEGERSALYRVRRSDGTLVVLKLPSSEAERAARLRALQREHEILLRLTGCPGIIGIHGALRDGGNYALCLHDFAGAPLAQRGLAGKQSLREFLDLALLLTDLLSQVHERGLLHGDFHPGNVLVGRTGELRLVDFANCIPSVSRASTPPALGPRLLDGVLAYVSPERTGRFNRAVDHRSDYYSLGVTLFELLTGSLPFPYKDPLELVHAQVARQPPHPGELLPGAPDTICDLILRLLAKDPEQRHSSAEAIRSELRLCVQSLEDSGSLFSFVRNRSERPAALTAPPLYGRGAETRKLEEILALTCEGSAAFITVTGAAGVGKSALVKQMLRPVIARRGYFVTGKFEQYGGGSLHTGISQALETLARQFLAQSSADLAELRSRITSALSGFGQALIELCPALELLIGAQPALPPLPSTETRARLQRVLSSFLVAIADPSRPICVFLDDVHWAGADSIALLNHLVCTGRDQALMVVVAYRDDEAFPGNAALNATIADLTAQEVRTETLALMPLESQDVRALVDQAFGLAEASSEALAQITWSRTAGNPFFVRAFLESLHSEGLIRASSEGGWVDLDLVRQRSVTENVVNLLIERINRLPLATQDALQVAACIGSRFDLDTLKIAASRTVVDDLKPAVRADLIQLTDGAMSDAPSYQFAHDRVQQAALGMLEPPARQRIRLAIGRRLLSRSADEVSRRLFEIVAHLNEALPLVVHGDERQELAELNLRAARAALLQAAGSGGLGLARKGIEALGDGFWDNHYDLARDLHLVAAEAAFAWAEHDALDALAREMVTRARNPADAVRVQRLQGRVYQAQSRSAAAIETYVGALAAMGVQIPQQPTEDDVREELRATAELLRDRSVEELADLPECVDETSVLAMELLGKLLFFGYSSATLLFSLTVCRLVRLSVERGAIAETANGLTFYGLLLTRDESQADAHRFGVVAMALAHRFNHPSVLSQTYLYVNYQLMHWTVPLRELFAPLRRAYEFGLAAGSPMNAGCSATTLCICRFWAGEELSALAAEMDQYRRVIIQFRQTLVRNWHEVLQQTVYNLRTPSARPQHLNGPFYEEDTRLPVHEARGDNSALFNYHIAKTFLCYLFEDYESALGHAQKNLAFPTIRSAIWAIPAIYLDSLCRLAVCEDHGATQRREHLEQVAQNLSALARLRQDNPSSVGHKISTIQAELARVNGDLEQARILFAEAVDLAAASACPPEEGIACELAARFSVQHGDRGAARYYVRAAHRCYARWGALAKVKALELANPELGVRLLTQEGAASLVEQEFDGLDFASVLNASRAISSEIKLDRFLVCMMRLLIEVGGAELGCLLVEKDGAWVVEAAQSAASEVPAAAAPADATKVASAASRGVSSSVVNYVAETGEIVLLEDAMNDARFAGDAHIAAERVASVLCFPLRRRGGLLGIVYLENNLARGVFTLGRTKLLELISAQVVISLENARVYDVLEQKVEARTAQLSEKNEELASTLDKLMALQEQLVSQEKLAALGLLTAGIAHEIKNPLNFVTNFASESERLLVELLAHTGRAGFAHGPNSEDPELLDLTANLRLALGKIGEHAKRASEIVSGMAMHARDGGGGRGPTALNQMLAQSVALVAHGFRASGDFDVLLATNYDPGVGEVEVVAEDIGRVFVNLITNARHALEEKRRKLGLDFNASITVSTRAIPNGAEVRVRDNGIGISRAIIDKIFVPFFTTKPSGQGTGLGLSISKDIARAHGGDLTVESEEANFTEVVLTLPKAAPRQTLR